MVPPSSYSVLAAEIDRIVASPYPSQLRTLRDLVVSRCTDADISQWAAAKPCLVESLTSCLLEGLQQWSYVLDIIPRFAVNKTCRNAFLRHEPNILHSVIAQAVKLGGTKSEYLKTSIALLSHHLPDTVALPTEAQTLFVSLVEEAAKRPCAGTIEPIFHVLNGTGNLLLGVLSSEMLIRFEEHMIEILKTCSGSPDNCLSLYCLSIMNVVCCSVDPEYRLTASSYNTQDFLASTPTSSRWKAEQMQQFFTGSKAQRSMQLIVLWVLWAAGRSANGDLSAEKVQTLVLANEVITAIPAGLRKVWCTANMVTVRKLQEKLCAENQDETAKTLALRFMGKLCELDSLPHPVLESIQRSFLVPRCMQIVRNLCPRVTDEELFSCVLAKAPIGPLLQNAVDYAIYTESPDLAAGLDAVTSTISGAASIIGEEKITGHDIRNLLNDAAFAQSLQRLHDLLQDPTGGHTSVSTIGWCGNALRRRRCKLAHLISTLLLRACHSSSISQDCTTLLLSLHAASARGDLDCVHSKTSWGGRVRFEEATGEDNDLVDWREALHTHFKARVSAEQNAVSQLFARACASLESRCENVERPLREEREKRKAAERHSKDLTKAFAEIEARNVDLTIQLRDAEDERDRHFQDLEDYQDQNTSLTERIEGLERKLRAANDEAKRQMQEFEQAKQIAKLDGAADIARKQEQVDDMEEQVQRVRRENALKEQELAGVQTDLVFARSECERLEEGLASTTTRITEMQNAVHDLEHRNGHLEEEKSRLQAELQDAGGNLENSSQEASELRQRLQNAVAEVVELKKSLAHETGEVRAELQRQLHEEQHSIQQLQESKEEVEKRHQDLRDELNETQGRYTADVEARDSKIAEYKKRIGRLQQKCEQKDQAIADAEAMRANLMAAMGISASGRLADRVRDSMASTQRTEQNHDEPTPTPPTPRSGGTDVDGGEPHLQYVSSFSSHEEKNGPTPKRARPRKSLAATRASMGGSKARTQPPASAMGTATKNKRHTLGVVSGNPTRTPAAVTFKTPMKEIANGGDDESTFEGSELFTGSQGRRTAELGLCGFEGDEL